MPEVKKEPRTALSPARRSADAPSPAGSTGSAPSTPSVQDARRTDRRILRTKASIQGALLHLLAQKPLTEITVTELSQAANVNRKTFYNYYSDVSMVLDEIENQIVAEFREALAGLRFQEMTDDPTKGFLALARLIYTDLDLYDGIFAADSMNSLLSKIVLVLKAYLLDAVRRQVRMDEELLEFLIDYSVAGTVAAYRRWFENGKNGSLEDLSRQVSRIAFLGIVGLLQDQSAGWRT